MDWMYSTYGEGGKRKVFTGFWQGTLRERDHLEGLGIGVRMILKIDLQEVGWVGGGRGEAGTG